MGYEKQRARVTHNGARIIPVAHPPTPRARDARGWRSMQKRKRKCLLPSLPRIHRPPQASSSPARHQWSVSLVPKSLLPSPLRRATACTQSRPTNPSIIHEPQSTRAARLSRQQLCRCRRVRFEREGENGASIRVISACGGRAKWRVLVWLATTEGRDGDAERRARGAKRYRMGRRGVEDGGGRGDGGHGADERGAEHFYAVGQEREEVRCIAQRERQRRTMQAACATGRQSREG
ncbi:hypothetical protein B0H13DRAFT_1043883 [Mycena leptocephala]|nr:hypothetical protein B0H13DRAFT_1043883 [Mycena leptocephala]